MAVHRGRKGREQGSVEDNVSTLNVYMYAQTCISDKTLFRSVKLGKLTSDGLLSSKLGEIFCLDRTFVL
jgi:hypothetical protein